MSKVIGIDLGSTLTEVCVMENGKPVVVPNEDGSFTTPSVVSIINGERKVGSGAKRQQLLFPKNTIYLVKRLMGRSYEEVKEFADHFQYDIVDNNGRAAVKIDDKIFTPEEISSHILAKMKKIAEDYCGEEVKDAVITCPAYFSMKAREATSQAGELANLNVLRVIAEPTAAILSSNIDMKSGGKYMVTDIGGSTADFSVADIEDSVVEILATNGDMFLGGSDVDKSLADYVVSEFEKESGIDIKGDPQAMTRVYEAVEKAKIELTTSPKSEINIPYISAKDNSPVHLVKEITRTKFEQLIDWFIKRNVECAKKALEMAKLNAKDLNGILLIGGSCRIPALQNAIEKEFGVPLIKSSNFDLAVAEGACIQANTLAGEGESDLLLLDVNPITLSIETLHGISTPMVPANSTIPCDKTEIFSTAVDNQSSITVNVLQGERPLAKDNKSLGIFNLDGILPAKRGVPQIEIKFSIDASGILSVTAKDKGTGKEQSIRIEGSGKLTDDEIAQIKADAEKYADIDKKNKEEAEKLNIADGLSYNVEKSIEELGDKISDSEKEEIKPLIVKLKNAVNDKDIQSLESTQKELESKWNQIMERVYQSQSSGGSTPFDGFDFSKNSNTNNMNYGDDSSTTQFEEVK